ncbi:protein VASCULATURE COMPLEXITY AND CONNECTIVITY isoform X2 [Hevea brasiliensis]|uniref:protein VASCULATURE COMPLEXITY AND CONNECTIVITY isoform X2 n=1 Tax=Hevea brasiliensis TaxID=3981 RepID=UPI000B7812C1|nr:protein VASCULATURE COMPLEXITY AND CONNECTIVITY isoform X2 [Hevea brasiliensis]
MLLLEFSAFKPNKIETSVQMIVPNGKTGSFQCRETKGDGFRLGVAATALLAVAHLAANLHGGFMCICCMEQLERSPSNRQLWFACLVFSWIVAAIGFPMLITGTLEISKSRGSCTALHSHFLSTGGIFCFVHALFCILLFVCASISFGNRMVNEHESPS